MIWWFLFNFHASPLKFILRRLIKIPRIICVFLFVFYMHHILFYFRISHSFSPGVIRECIQQSRFFNLNRKAAEICHDFQSYGGVCGFSICQKIFVFGVWPRLFNEPLQAKNRTAKLTQTYVFPRIIPHNSRFYYLLSYFTGEILSSRYFYAGGHNIIWMLWSKL